ncbi:MAG: DUF5329 family protein [Bdellovibrionales bacterium]
MRSFSLLIFLFLGFQSNATETAWDLEKKKIDFLLLELSRVEGKFERNGDFYSSEDARNHLKMKLQNAVNSWFSPPKSKWTAKMFIEKLASKSSISGKAYKIHFKTGKVEEARRWLLKRLEKYKEK